MRSGLCLFLLMCVFMSSGVAYGGNSLLRPDQVAVVVNENDANSTEIGRYYVSARRIPTSNLIRVSLPDPPHVLSFARFAQLKRQIDGQLPPGIQVVVLAWTAPYAVECNSITSAMTLGFDPKQCQSTCSPGRPNPYFDSAAELPSQLGLKLTILLPTDSVSLAKAVIGHGVLSGFRINEAGAYYLTTSDRNRNSRSMFFPRSGSIPELHLEIHNLHADDIEGKNDVILYETGRVSVPKLDTLNFLPGALADHLTSTGGDLLGTGQMSSLKWLEAGATASFGTVSEPCNYWQKFPNPAVLLKHYLSGETAVESYWKSVAWPAQGLIIGEPLAAPYCTACSGNRISSRY